MNTAPKSTAAATAKKKSTTKKKKTSQRSLESTITSAVRREITRQTGIPTTESGIKNKVGRMIVDGILGLFTGKKKTAKKKKGDITADL